MHESVIVHIVAPDEGTDSCGKLGRVERFREVVIGACLESHKLVIEGPVRRAHDNRSLDTVLAKALRNLDAVHLRELDIHDNCVISVTASRLISVDTVDA